MPNYGTLITLDTLRSQFATQTIAGIGEDRVFAGIEAERVAHNAIIREMLSDYVDFSGDRLRRYGGPSQTDMEEIDEQGAPQAQKVAAGAVVSFPLRLFAYGVQWTRKFMQNATGEELAIQFTAAQDADVRALTRELKRAIFIPTNYNFIDKLTDYLTLPVKRLVNADGAPIPSGPNGETFNGATHNHYLFTASTTWATADLDAAIDTVVEHYQAGQAYLYINRADETAMRALTGFVPYVDARIVQSQNINRAEAPLEVMQLNNRAIGIYRQAEVWVKPWIPPGYMWAWVMGAPKPVVARTRVGQAGDLQIAAEFDQYPLRARALEREIGFGVWERTNGAILYKDTGAAGAYVAPTIT